jgi:hypothetical protein
MDSAEPMVLKPRKASPLTAGENMGVLLSDSAQTEWIDKNKQNARNIVPAQNLDMMEFEGNITNSFCLRKIPLSRSPGRESFPELVNGLPPVFRQEGEFISLFIRSRE